MKNKIDYWLKIYIYVTHIIGFTFGGIFLFKEEIIYLFLCLSFIMSCIPIVWLTELITFFIIEYEIRKNNVI